MRKNRLFVTLPIVFILLIWSSCNILDWTSTSTEEEFYRGLTLFNEQKFGEAREKFAEALEKDPNNSEYLYYHAKATVFESDLDFYSIARRIINIDTSSFQNLKLPLYTKEPDMTLAQDARYKNKIYQATWSAHDDISPIYFNNTHGDVEAIDISFEFSILSMARAILQMRDTNNDLVINENDLYFTIQKVYNPFIGKSIYLPNLTDIYEYLKDSQENRAGFNKMLVNTASYAAEGVASIMNTFSDTTLFDNDDLEEIIEKVETMGNFYQVNDNIDNDNDGQIDEESINLMDDDEDGYIDEDAHL
ncbi:hypothetical protein GF337_07305 [candidate division KSB1 bacterium]|nr:hypothetical protein [candidate division KSB1 bacterium]